MPRRTISMLKILDYPVPSHSNRILYMFGGISLAAFLILMLSGIYIGQFYSPTPEKAHTSIVYAITQVPLADFMRSLHFWTANLVVVLLLFHVVRVFITGSYKKPRILTWLTGVALLAVTYIYIFVGTALKWDQEGVEAVVHMQESFNLLGIQIGLVNGGVPVITQLYSWHVTILLLMLLSLIAIHMFLIKLRGISSKPEKNAVSETTAGKGSSSFIVHLRRLSGFGLLFLAVAGILAIVFPAPIGSPGILDQEVTKPLWMFWPFFGLENIFGLKGLVWGMIGFFAILAALPFVDRSPYIHWSKRKLILAFGAVFLAVTIGLGVYSRINEAEEHIEMEEGTAMTEKATADVLNISHGRLRNEAYYLAPALVALGSYGAWLARRKE